MFIATVLSKQIVPRGQRIGPYQLSEAGDLVRVKILESFSPDQRVGEEVLVETNHPGGSCGYSFTIGEQYFIDASSYKGVLVTSICQLTGTVASRTIVIRELRMAAAKQRLPDLTGLVQQFRSWNDQSPLPGILVNLYSNTSAVPLHAITDTAGVYRFDHLPSGTYRITVDLPANLVTGPTNIGSASGKEIPPLTISRTGTASAACKILIWAEPSGTISGRLVLPGVERPRGLVTAFAETAHQKNKRRVSSWPVQEDGTFSIHHLAAGRYLILFEATGSRDPAPSARVTLHDGEQKRNLQLAVRKRPEQPQP